MPQSAELGYPQDEHHFFTVIISHVHSTKSSIKRFMSKNCSLQEKNVAS